MDETWLPVVGDNRYAVSNLGNVRSVDHAIVVGCRWGGLVSKRVRSRQLKPWYAGHGYAVVALGAGRKNRAYVHRLVAEAFIPNYGHKPQVNHRNGNKKDNSAVNLEWVSLSENSRHATRVLGKRGGQFGPGRIRHAAGCCTV